MSISRQIMLFTTAAVILAMAVLYTISSVVFDKLQQNTAFNYLETTSYVAEELIDRRLAEMESASAMVVETLELPGLIGEGKEDELEDCLLYLRRVCPYISFALFTDPECNQLASLPGTGKGAALLFRDNLLEMKRSG